MKPLKRISHILMFLASVAAAGNANSQEEIGSVQVMGNYASFCSVNTPLSLSLNPSKNKVSYESMTVSLTCYIAKDKSEVTISIPNTIHGDGYKLLVKEKKGLLSKLLGNKRDIVKKQLIRSGQSDISFTYDALVIRSKSKARQGLNVHVPVEVEVKA
jgi:hypothetical protein